jgi:UDP-2,3-diacylglucosamine pyrophosphatase LpxH
MSSIRSIFVSDVHLGCRYTHAEALLQFLRAHEPEHLYLVGDIIDGWRLQRGWYWTDTYTYLLRHIVGLMKRGTRVYYTPGNHDEFLRYYLHDLGSIQIADELVHVTADGRRLLVMHGDQFDTAVRHAPWLAHLGDTGYNVLLGMNIVFNGVRRRLGMEYWSLSAAVKRRVKQATNFISNFETLITQHAADRDCAGVVCGHIHTPRIASRGGIGYYNTGWSSMGMARSSCSIAPGMPRRGNSPGGSLEDAGGGGHLQSPTRLWRVKNVVLPPWRWDPVRPGRSPPCPRDDVIRPSEFFQGPSACEFPIVSATPASSGCMAETWSTTPVGKIHGSTGKRCSCVLTMPCW